MRQSSLIVLLIFSLSTFGQLKFPKDSITNFSLKYTETGGTRDIYYSVDINSKGKIKVIYKVDGDKTVGKKLIRLDKNTFRQFKNTIISERQVYFLADSVYNNNAQDAGSNILIIKYNFGEKKIESYALESIDKNYKFIIEQIYDLIGRTIGNESDAK